MIGVDIIDTFLKTEIFSKYRFVENDKMILYSYINGSRRFIDDLVRKKDISEEDVKYINIAKSFYDNKDAVLLQLFKIYGEKVQSANSNENKLNNELAISNNKNKELMNSIQEKQKMIKLIQDQLEASKANAQKLTDDINSLTKDNKKLRKRFNSISIGDRDIDPGNLIMFKEFMDTYGDVTISLMFDRLLQELLNITFVGSNAIIDRIKDEITEYKTSRRKYNYQYLLDILKGFIDLFKSDDSSPEIKYVASIIKINDDNTSLVIEQLEELVNLIEQIEKDKKNKLLPIYKGLFGSDANTDYITSDMIIDAIQNSFNDYKSAAYSIQFYFDNYNLLLESQNKFEKDSNKYTINDHLNEINRIAAILSNHTNRLLAFGLNIFYHNIVTMISHFHSILSDLSKSFSDKINLENNKKELEITLSKLQGDLIKCNQDLKEEKQLLNTSSSSSQLPSDEEIDVLTLTLTLGENITTYNVDNYVAAFKSLKNSRFLRNVRLINLLNFNDQEDILYHTDAFKTDTGIKFIKIRDNNTTYHHLYTLRNNTFIKLEVNKFGVASADGYNQLFSSKVYLDSTLNVKLDAIYQKFIKNSLTI